MKRYLNRETGETSFGMPIVDEPELSKWEEVPEDYEPCGECGYDHGYETAHAVTAHTNMMFAMAFDAIGKK